jgi:sodium-independent sulfate anion transporter 11
MSLLVGQTITRVTVTGEYTGPQVAVLLALFGGFIALFLGLVRLGILVDFIPGPAIAGFMTGSSITISVGQWPKLFGIKTVNTHESAYLVFGNFFKHLPDTKLDVAFGLIGLLWLYTVRWGTGHLTKKYPQYEKIFFFANIMRNGVLVIVGTLIAFLINIGKSSSPISILNNVPSGFTAMGVPSVDIGLLSQVSSTLPSVVIILVLEHVAIAKSFGRINNYKIDADQEIIAIGAANIVGSFFGKCICGTFLYTVINFQSCLGAYPNTGSFSRTAITARSGARTPLTGIFSALVVLLCLYALTPAFYYIPDAILSAIIIHAVADLVSGPKFLRQLFKVSPFELFTFIAAVLITFFTSVEYGIYVSVGMSIVAMLLRIARPRYAVLGRIPVHPTPTGTITASYCNPNDPGNTPLSDKTSNLDENIHYIYVKQDHQTLSHLVESPPEGVVIFRFDESLTYPNAGFISDKIMNYIQDNFDSGSPPPTSKGERAWNDRRPLAKKQTLHDEHVSTVSTELQMPKLRAIVLDCAAINHLDSTGIQTLLDLKLSISRYAGYEVEWHFASIGSPSIRNALVTSGFGSQAGRGPRTGELLPVVPVHRDGPQGDLNNSEIQNHSSHTDVDVSIEKIPTDHIEDLEHIVPNDNPMSYIVNVDGQGQIEYYPRLDRGLPIDRYPFFHWDLEDAVRAASYTHERDSST